MLTSNKPFALVGCAALIAAVIGCSDDSVQEIDFDEPYGHASLQEIGVAADLVVRGEVAGLETGVRIGEDRSIEYRVYTVRVAQTDPQVSDDTIRIAISEVMDGQAFQVAGKASLDEGDQAIFALTEIDESFEFEGFVLVNSQSIFPVEGNNEVQHDGEGTLSDQADGSTPEDVFDELVSHR